MSRAEAAIQALYEDSRLREDLVDDEADVLLRWAENKLMEMDAASSDDDAWAQVLTSFKDLLRGVNQYIGQRTYATPETQTATYATIQAQAAALSLPVPAQSEPTFSAQTAGDDGVAALKALLSQMDAPSPRMTKSTEPSPAPTDITAASSGGARLNLFGLKSAEPEPPAEEPPAPADDTSSSSGGARLNLFGLKSAEPEPPAEEPPAPADDKPASSGGARLNLFGLKSAEPEPPAEEEDTDKPTPKSFGERFSLFGDRSTDKPSTTSGRSGGETADDDASDSGEGE